MRQFYLQEGYADFQVTSANAELAQGQEEFFLTFNIIEGPRYKVGEIAIDSKLRGFDGAVLRDVVTLLPGEFYNADEIQRTVDAMTQDLGDRQYAFVDIDPNIERNVSDRTVDITYNIAESPRVFVERIDIRGNVRTIDKVIRREMRIVEGDPFNRTELARSEQNCGI